ncbi:hypothetical protein D9M70_597880 [compost metagenome]
MPDVQQIVGDALRRRGVVPSHHRPGIGVVVVAGSDEGNAFGMQQFVEFGVAAAPDQHHCVDAAFDQRAHFARFARGAVVGAGQQ